MTASPTRGAAIELVTVGHELLLGHTVDTNAAYAGQRFADAGVRVVRRATVGDNPADIAEAVSSALDRTGMVLTTGGLGPTRDDITKHVVSELLGMPLAFNDEIWAELLARWQRIGRVPSESNRTQAMVPTGAMVLPNRWGTAPGLWIPSPRGTVIMLPGVPNEMRNLLDHEVVPRLVDQGGGVVRSRTLRTAGIAESALAELVDPLEEELAPLTLAYLPDVAGVDLRLTAWQLPAAEADARLTAGSARLRDLAGQWIYGEGDDDLAAVLLTAARAAGRLIAVAESCTGGLLGGRITAIPGSSDYFVGGVIAYHDAVKTALLGVPAELIARHGAVSGEVAEAMVRGVAERTGADLALSITGIAGPDGGSETKPVGTVWFGLLDCNKVTAIHVGFPGTRPEIRARAVQAGLGRMLEMVIGRRS
ncbi:MAG: competence/damage-inducible protein A [Gemmatimonadales bacterium]|nr:competence/damage-inducible protein A [Gemmatimonadales bacterium]